MIAFAVALFKSTGNQCMGCQAEWPIAGRTHRKFIAHPGTRGGHMETVVCTADRYVLRSDS